MLIEEFLCFGRQILESQPYYVALGDFGCIRKLNHG
jgi:hypothetical protein